MKPSCATCLHLSDCKEATEHKDDLEQHHCRNWAKAEDPKLAARKWLRDELGPTALRYELADYKLSANHKIRRR